MDEVFGTVGHVSWWQECGRAVVIFVFGLVLVRVSGRRIFGKWSALDIVVSIMVGSNLSRALTGGAELWGTMAATTLMMVLHAVLAQVAARSPWLAKVLEGAMIPLALGGSERSATLERHAVTRTDLAEALRQVGVEQVSQTRLVALEPSGKITVLKAGS